MAGSHLKRDRFTYVNPQERRGPITTNFVIIHGSFFVCAPWNGGGGAGGRKCKLKNCDFQFYVNKRGKGNPLIDYVYAGSLLVPVMVDLIALSIKQGGRKLLIYSTKIT